MSYRRSTLAFAAALALILACGDGPVAPRAASIAPVEDASPASVRGGNTHGATLSGVVNETIGDDVIAAVVRVTRLSMSDDGQLLASGIISGTANGEEFTQTFTDIAAALITSSQVAAAADIGIMQAGSACDILLLDLGPLHLDILGLVIDLSPVSLDIVAEAGGGNLLGNLLCAVVRLLDGPGVIAAVANLLEQINAIIGALGG